MNLKESEKCYTNEALKAYAQRVNNLNLVHEVAIRVLEYNPEKLKQFTSNENTFTYFILKLAKVELKKTGTPEIFEITESDQENKICYADLFYYFRRTKYANDFYFATLFDFWVKSNGNSREVARITKISDRTIRHQINLIKIEIMNYKLIEELEPLALAHLDGNPVNIEDKRLQPKLKELALIYNATATSAKPLDPDKICCNGCGGATLRALFLGIYVNHRDAFFNLVAQKVAEKVEEGVKKVVAKVKYGRSNRKPKGI